MAKILGAPLVEENQGEARVGRLLRGLPDDWLVFHSFQWSQPYGRQIKEGEADFIVAHPRYGVLVVEVKGGALRINDGTWERRTRGQWQPSANPITQVLDSVNFVRRLLQSRDKEARTPPLRVEWALVTPDASVVDPNKPEASFWTSEDLSTVPIEELVTRSLNAFGRVPSVAGDRAWARFKARIAPNAGMVLGFSDELLSHERVFKELTDDQKRILRRFSVVSRALVGAQAGTGKTFLAIEKACGLDLQDKRVLFLCYNKSLKRWLQILVTDAIDGGATFRDFVYIGHFHMFARNAAKKAGLQFPQKPTDDWWGSGAAVLLDKSIDTIKQADSFRPYDALVVDEAQDFHQSWWRPLLSKAITPDADVWLFSDTNQAIHQEDPVPPPLEGAEVFTLTKVVRSTRRIAAAGRSVSGAPFPIDGVDPTPAGADVELSFVENEIDGRERVMALVESLLKEGINPNQLVLINPNVHAKGWLKDIDRIAQWKIGDTDDLASWHKGDTLLNTTPRSFKGLEAPVVILYGLAGFAGWFNEKDLYVAITRARSRLYVLAIASCSPTMRSRLDNAAKIANAITAG